MILFNDLFKVIDYVAIALSKPVVANPKILGHTAFSSLRIGF